MKIRKATGIFLVISLLFSVLFVPFTVSAKEPADAQSFLEEQMEKYNLSGVAYITRNGEVLAQYARGMANNAEEKAMTIDTLFPLGSNSKQFCATSILLLQEQGKLSVDEPITKYFPEYTKAQGVTIKNLLTMRSGIVEYNSVAFAEYTPSVDATAQENQQIILDWLYTQELTFKPDQYHEYINTNFFLLSIIVEQVSGQSYHEFVKENIFIPLGMENSGSYEEFFNHPDLAELTCDTNGIPVEAEVKGLSNGAGDLVSNAKDMDKWLTSFKEGTILSEESITEMTTDYSFGVGYGYGISIHDDGALTHGGMIQSYYSLPRTYTQDGFNVFVATNYLQTQMDFASNIVDAVSDKLNPKGIVGDSNFNKAVNVKDATSIQKHVAGLITLTEPGLTLADADSNGKVNVKDATAIQKYVAGIETGLPIGEYVSL